MVKQTKLSKSKKLNRIKRSKKVKNLKKTIKNIKKIGGTRYINNETGEILGFNNNNNNISNANVRLGYIKTKYVDPKKQFQLLEKVIKWIETENNKEKLTEDLLQSYFREISIYIDNELEQLSDNDEKIAMLEMIKKILEKGFYEKKINNLKFNNLMRSYETKDLAKIYENIAYLLATFGIYQQGLPFNSTESLETFISLYLYTQLQQTIENEMKILEELKENLEMQLKKITNGDERLNLKNLKQTKKEPIESQLKDIKQKLNLLKNKLDIINLKKEII